MQVVKYFFKMMVFLFVILSFLSEIGQAQTIPPICTYSSGSINLYATGLDINLENNIDNSPVYLTFDGCLALFESAKVTSYGFGWRGDGTAGIAAFTSTAFTKTSSGDLGISVVGSGEGGWAYSPVGGGEASVSWNDTISLFWRSSDQIPTWLQDLAGDGLYFNYKLEGSLKNSLRGINAGYATASVEVAIGHEYFSASANKDGRWNPFGEDLSLTPLLKGKVELDNNLQAPYTTTLSGGVSVSWGNSSSTFGNTLTFDSVTFIDGTTPESHGFDVVFESGIHSPNLRNIDGLALYEFIIDFTNNIHPSADLNSDGVINRDDISIFALGFGGALLETGP